MSIQLGQLTLKRYIGVNQKDKLLLLSRGRFRRGRRSAEVLMSTGAAIARRHATSLILIIDQSSRHPALSNSPVRSTYNSHRSLSTMICETPGHSLCSYRNSGLMPRPHQKPAYGLCRVVSSNLALRRRPNVAYPPTVAPGLRPW